MKRLSLSIILLVLTLTSYGQKGIVKDFAPVCDSLAVLLDERTGVHGKVDLKSVMKRKGHLDFYFTESLGDYPWYDSDPQWLQKTLKSLLPEGYRKYRIGRIYSRRVPLKELVTPTLKNGGKPSSGAGKAKDPSRRDVMVKKHDAILFDKGLSGRHIALWQSHGRYYSHAADKWEWQRPCLFQTCEDMFTQGFVLPFLVPMLENAGAYVMLPRERDTQKNEIIADNDPALGGRGKATYRETGKWSDAGTGFADIRQTYRDLENPFTYGTARQTACIPHGKKTSSAAATWTPDIPERGRYAVYVSYRSLPNSTTSALYTVSHLGGTDSFIVNQKMGGGTWIYLGTFEFDEGKQGHVRLDSRTPEGYRHSEGNVVTADAVRFGGGMGNIERGHYDDTTFTHEPPCTSGLPRSAEAARYWLQWAGADSTIYYQNEGQNDYRDDFMSRGDWVEWLSRGSRMNPSRKPGPGIPIDLSLGFHSDAGVTPDDSIVGTLAIYTLKSERSRKLPNKEDRMTSRQLADMVQSQIIHDLRAEYDSLWTRRSIWDRGYRETRTPSSPAMILELLSHQNFADMRHGLDPSFRFAAGRAVYKGIVKYLSNRYGCDYAIQPLPVDHMATEFESGNRISVSWKPVYDSLEPTADPSGFIVYRRIGDGAFDNGTIVTDFSVDSGGYIRWWTDIPSGEVVSFKVAAFNDGGLSFPSETVSIGIPARQDSHSDKPVLIVNNFDRVSGPAHFDSGQYAGFSNSTDSGVPYINDITYIGDMYDFRRNEEWISNERPGFGASYTDMAGEIIAGNTFDYPSVHGKAILAAGHPFRSCSNERFVYDQYIRTYAWSVDMICGKQVTTKVGNRQKYSVFPSELQTVLREFTSNGGNILISGAYIGTDLWDTIYPGIKTDSTATDAAVGFAKEILGYRPVTNQAAGRCRVDPVNNPDIRNLGTLEFNMEYRSDIYRVESPDGIAPAGKSSKAICRYADSGITAGVAYDAEGYRCVSLGFPIETLLEPSQIENIISTTLDYFRK